LRQPATSAVLVALLTVLVVRLAMSNHRYADRNLPRIAAHGALFVVALVVELAAFGALGIR
jgi:hypothetical protein